MKAIRILFICLICVMILLPLASFNFTPDTVSEIDNRKLAESPFTAQGDFTENTEAYVNDRIGLRDEMILAHTVINDTLFRKMSHPLYSYGKDGYVFGSGITTNSSYDSYHESFVSMVCKIQKYCEERNVPFIFVFNPAKPAVYSDKLRDGICYDRKWAEDFLAELDKRGVRYIDNTRVLIDKRAEGEKVFNQKYDANHWNSLGAFYGVNAILEELKKDFPSVHVNTKDEMQIEETLQETLQVSRFPIRETTVTLIPPDDYTDNSSCRAELEINESYNTFCRLLNNTRMAEGSPRALVFQGSYMNVYGYPFMANALGEYVYVHDYQNVMNVDYYFNLFRPDCVIFEVAEYTFSDTYFDREVMNAMDLNPRLDHQAVHSTEQLPQQSVSVESGNELTKIRLKMNGDYAWLTLNEDYDMRKTEDGFEVTVRNEVLNTDTPMLFTVRNGESTISYSLR